MDKRTSIIIVDNDTTLLTMLQEIFVSEGYRCETAASAHVALELIDKAHFDIMVTDIVMPGMTGIELTEKAKKLRPHIAAVVITGFIDDFTYDRAIEAGASDFVKKPFTMKEIINRVKHVESQEKLRLLSITDELTGLYNRRGFFTLADQQLKLARRLKKGIFMLYADVDNLKLINDKFGHQEGDLALLDIAGILKATYRESDIIARIGGDEFTVIPIGTTGDNIGKITTRLQKNIENHNATENRKYTLSISFGVSYFNPETPCSIDELLAHGDKMMYEQKRLRQQSL